MKRSVSLPKGLNPLSSGAITASIDWQRENRFVCVSIPFQAGQLLRVSYYNTGLKLLSSQSPFKRGNYCETSEKLDVSNVRSLNPLSSGAITASISDHIINLVRVVSIPFQAGQLLRGCAGGASRYARAVSIPFQAGQLLRV